MKQRKNVSIICYWTFLLCHVPSDSKQKNNSVWNHFVCQVFLFMKDVHGDKGTDLRGEVMNNSAVTTFYSS